VLFSVVVLLPLSGAAPLVVVVVVESVDFCVTSGEAAAAGDASGAGVVCVVVVVVVVSSLLPLHPTISVPAMTVNPVAVANNIILFEIFIGRTYHIQRFLYGGQALRERLSHRCYRH
jgi:hypothetical protein